jgi:2-hydroxy-6-oxonona-2,4-dienedioate hydrolase
MPKTQTSSGYVSISNAKLYYEVSGSGIPIVMLHAGVADSRQWNNEFKHFSQYYQSVRYDMRGYGKSEPVAGKFSHLTDISEIFKAIQIDPPLIMMGCSMGGGLGLDYTLANPSKVKALIMVGSGPSGLELDVEEPAKFTDAVKAFEDGDLDQVAEIETQIWFDGIGRTPEKVNQNMRQLAYEMNRTALGHEVKELGERQADTDLPAYERLNEIDIPVLIIVGSQDIPYIHAAADYMDKGLKNSRVVIIEDAAHLPNMDQPVKFQRILTDFLSDLVL